jgi:transmembrane sensor
MNKRALSFTLAALSLSIFAGILSFVPRGDLQPAQVITTGASQWRHTTLTDGTTVHVDARSQVKVDYTDEVRMVYVEQGSAAFDVAKDAKRPFVARTRLVDATAVGTRFGVSIDPGVTTTVAEGVVKVTTRGQRDSSPGVLLRAGEEFRVIAGRQSEPSHLKVDAERKLEWATGWLAFDGETIGEVVDAFNRRNAVQIDIEQPDLAARPMRGYLRFRVDASAALARYIAETNDLIVIEDRSGSVLGLRPKGDDPAR